MRSDFTSGMPPTSPRSPLAAAAWIGDSGGTYQTIGSVRYSGCSGKAIFQSIAIFHTGERLRGFQPRFGDAVGARLRLHLRVERVEEHLRAGPRRGHRSSGAEAAASIRSASYSTTPR